MIELADEALEAMRRHARETYPEECCGALLGETVGDTARVVRIEPLENGRQSERRRRFRISPELYRQVESSADAQRLSLVGFYHSHPDHAAVPSEYDREHALPFFHYVVLAVSSDGAGGAVSWVLSEDRERFDREILELSVTEE